MAYNDSMVYLDYAATTPILPEVIEAMNLAYHKDYGNASALHSPGHLAHNEIEECRALLAECIGAEPDEIIFTSGSTESNNTVVRIFEGCEIKTSPLEHHSIIEAAQLYNGTKRPMLYSYMLANNETGDILDLSEIVSRASKTKIDESSDLFKARDRFGRELVTDKRGAYVHSDLTQTLGKIPFNVKALGLDYATFSAHKIGGPIGVGALYVRKGVPFKPFMIGGNQESGRRGGTYNTVGIIGFRKALELAVSRENLERFDNDVRTLRDALANRILNEIPFSSLNTDLEKGKSLPNVLNVSFKAAEGESIQLYLDAEGIIVSTGSACAAGDTRPSHVLMAKTGDAEVAHSSIRFSFGLNSPINDVEAVMKVLPGIVKRLQGISTLKI